MLGLKHWLRSFRVGHDVVDSIMVLLAVPAALRLKLRVKAMSYYLRSQGVGCTINLQYRKRRVAHRWSTAYGIYNGDVTLGTLRQRSAGRDDDGTVWWLPEWDCHGSDDVSAATCPAIVDNAVQVGPNHMVYAQEGYRVDDSRRWPNVATAQVSAHVRGCAIDLNVDWSQLGGPWSSDACSIVQRFGLTRPYTDEAWHVEIDANYRPIYSWFAMLKWVLRSKS